jgi:hypothetical protein
VWYFTISEAGYESAPSHLSVAFFPGYPIAADTIGAISGMPTIWSLLLASHLCLVAAFCIFGTYVSDRSPELGIRHVRRCVLLLGLLPTTFFFRMVYSESAFVLLVAMTLFAISRRWSVWLVAFVVGAASGTRFVGLALLPVLATYAWRCHREDESGKRTWARGAAIVGAVVVIGCWGIIAYAAYLWDAFGDPLAFAKAQPFFRLRSGAYGTLTERMCAVALLEPIWSTYVPSMGGYWATYDRQLNGLFSLQFSNPVYFVGCAVLVVAGWRKRWLNDYELLLSAGLLMIPYVTKSYDNAMASFGRFSAVVLPAYIVMGHVLARLPWFVSAAILLVSAFLLCAYSALFAAGYRLL